jgi:hypothetical protein
MVVVGRDPGEAGLLARHERTGRQTWAGGSSASSASDTEAASMREVASARSM